MNSRITIVSGMPRCGTSMMMKMLEAGGLEPVTDQERRPDIDNPLGYYELEKVKKIAADASWLPDARGKVFKMVSSLLRFLPAGFDYDIIVMKRNMQEMLASQAKMLERLGTGGGQVDDRKMAALFQRQIQDVDQWLAGQPNVRTLEVQYNDVIADAAGHARRIAAFLAPGSDSLDPEAMARVVTPELHRNRVS
jgi:hypothetical protein